MSSEAVERELGCDVAPAVRCLFLQPQTVQGSAEWLEMRKHYLTASTAAAVYNKYPWKSKAQLFWDKVRGEESFFFNDAMKRGKDNEDVAAFIYEQKYGRFIIDFGLLAHPKIRYLAGSPDGVTPDGRLLEIKCPGRIAPAIPDYYFAQVQINMEVMDLDICDFVQYCVATGDLSLIEVPRDRTWFAWWKQQADVFWTEIELARIDPAVAPPEYVLKRRLPPDDDNEQQPPTTEIFV